MANVKIDYAEIEEMIEGQIIALRNSEPNFSALNFLVENERQFTIEKKRKPNTIYIVIHYESASTNSGMSTLPVTLRIISEANRIEMSYSFFSAFVSSYTTKRNGRILQVWGTPTMTKAFNDIANDWRASMTISGVLVVGSSQSVNVKSLSIYDGTNDEEIELLSYDEEFTNHLSPQAFSNDGGRTKSVSDFGTLTFSMSTYMNDGALCSKLNKLRYEEGHENDDFFFTMTLTNGEGFTRRKFKCAGINMSQKIGDNTLIVATFTD